jgi:hypothetical protein
VAEHLNANSSIYTGRFLRHLEDQRATTLESAPELADEMAGFVPDLPDRTVHDAATVDLGGRSVDLRFLGRGHTDNDIVVLVPDATVMFAGDLVENNAPPNFEDGYPLDWPIGARDDQPPLVVADGAYGKRPLLVVIRRLQMTLVSRLAKNAALWTQPSRKRRKGQRGPLPTYGKQRIDLARRAENPHGWQEVSCVQYRKVEIKRIKTFVATWRPACGAIRVVLVMEEERRHADQLARWSRRGSSGSLPEPAP